MFVLLKGKQSILTIDKKNLSEKRLNNLETKVESIENLLNAIAVEVEKLNVKFRES